MTPISHITGRGHFALSKEKFRLPTEGGGTKTQDVRKERCPQGGKSVLSLVGKEVGQGGKEWERDSPANHSDQLRASGDRGEEERPTRHLEEAKKRKDV